MRKVKFYFHRQQCCIHLSHLYVWHITCFFSMTVVVVVVVRAFSLYFIIFLYFSITSSLQTYNFRWFKLSIKWSAFDLCKCTVQVAIFYVSTIETSIFKIEWNVWCVFCSCWAIVFSYFIYKLLQAVCKSIW